MDKVLAAMPRYEVYKDSGVEWLGAIPEHWSLLANKHIFILKKTLVGKRSDEYDLLSLTLRGIIKRDMENPEGKFPTDFDTYQVVRPGDFVFCLFDVEETPRTVGLSKYAGMITGAYTVFGPKGGLNAAFLTYFYLNLDAHKWLKPLYKGLRNTIPKDAFFGFKTVIPPLAEQKAIAAYLDSKTTQIDQAIQTREKQIALLQERRQILIQNAVTRGLAPDAPMKDSGVEWIGEIPAHWEVKRAKYLFTEVDERSVDGQEELLSVSHMTGVTPRSEKNVSMFMAEDYTGSKTCLKDDLVFNIMWTWMGALGVSGTSGIVSPSYGVFRQKTAGRFNPKYLEYLLKTTKYIEHYNRVSTGLHSSRLRFYGHMFFAMELGFPERKEQDKIIEYVEHEATKISKAITLQQQQIDRLKEYRATLINSAVTGKIKVE